MSDVRTVPAVEPRPIIPSLAAFYSHARDLSWVVVRLTAGGMLLVHGIMKVMPMVEKGVVPTIEAFPALVTKNVMFRRLRQWGRRLLRRLLLCFDAGRHADRCERQRGEDECIPLVHRSLSLGFVLNDSVNGRFLDRPEAKWVGRQTHQWRPTV